MKKAKEMFEELGFECSKNEFTIRYYKEFRDYVLVYNEELEEFNAPNLEYIGDMSLERSKVYEDLKKQIGENKTK